MTPTQTIALCIRRCATPSDDAWHNWRSVVACYSSLRNGSKERDMPAWMACEAAAVVGTVIAARASSWVNAA